MATSNFSFSRLWPAQSQTTPSTRPTRSSTPAQEAKARARNAASIGALARRTPSGLSQPKKAAAPQDGLRNPRPAFKAPEGAMPASIATMRGNVAAHCEFVATLRAKLSCCTGLGRTLESPSYAEREAVHWLVANYVTCQYEPDFVAAMNREPGLLPAMLKEVFDPEQDEAHFARNLSRGANALLAYCLKHDRHPIFSEALENNDLARLCCKYGFGNLLNTVIGHLGDPQREKLVAEFESLLTMAADRGHTGALKALAYLPGVTPQARCAVVEKNNYALPLSLAKAGRVNSLMWLLADSSPLFRDMDAVHKWTVQYKALTSNQRAILWASEYYNHDLSSPRANSVQRETFVKIANLTEWLKGRQATLQKALQIIV